MAVDPAGNVYLTGYFRGTVDFGGGPLVSAGSLDAYTMSLTRDGAYRWAQRLGGTSSDSGTAICVNKIGDVYTTGRFTDIVDVKGTRLTAKGEYDIFLVAYTSAGKERWAKGIGGSSKDAPFDIVTDDKGNVTLTGRFQADVDFGGGVISSHGSSDIFIAGYARDGAHRWSKGIGGASGEAGRRLAVDSAGDVFFTGFFSGSVDPGGGTLTSNGSSDILLARYTSQGVLRWQEHFGGASYETGLG